MATETRFEKLLGIGSGTGGRPAFGQAGARWIDTTGPTEYVDTGSGWVALISSAVAMAQIAISSPGGNVASISFSSIPGTYNALLLVWYARTSSGNGSDALQVTFNSDTTSGHYRWGISYNSSNAASSSAAYARMGEVAGGAATANYYHGGKIWIPAYANTTGFKPLIGNSGWVSGGPDYAHTSEGLWLSTAAVTAIALTPTAGNFIGPGTQAILYGLT